MASPRPPSPAASDAAANGDDGVAEAAPEEFWLFGYGSLIWKPPPHYDLRVPGFITGYVRRFWQASEDHRGTPLSPGRVVTLITHPHWSTLTDPHPPSPRVWGAAYRIPRAHVPAVTAYLDIRETNGYTIDFVDFVPASPSPAPSPTIRALLYIGTPSNPQFTGPHPPAALAAHIAASAGPSGSNVEYLLELEAALARLGAPPGEVDEHVRDLAERVRGIWRAEGRVGMGVAGAGARTGVGGHEEEVEVERVG